MPVLIIITLAALVALVHEDERAANVYMSKNHQTAVYTQCGHFKSNF